MPKMEECLIDINLALALRGLAEAMNLDVPEGKIGFLCPNPNCRGPVNPHKAGGGHAAHFEHLARNPTCPLSDVPAPRT